MIKLALFAASRDQKKYFSQLDKQVTVDTKVVWYKKLVVPTFLVKFPFAQLWRQAQLLTTRKQNSRKGKNYPNWLWPLFTSLSFIQAIWLYAVYSRWLKREPASHIGLWNGKKFRQAILAIALPEHDKQGIFFETGPLPGVSAIDPKGVNFYSSIPNDVAFYLHRSLAGHEDETRSLSKQPKPEQLPKSYILVPFQVVEDSNIYLHSSWIRNMRQLFSLCQSLSKKLGDQVCFVFKEHPACDEQYDDLKQLQTEQLIFAENISTPELVNFSNAIITVNSTVGIEGLIARKKVFVLGDALFGIQGITYPVSSESSLTALLSDLDDLILNEQAIASFIDYLQHDYAIPGNAMKEPDENHWQAADQRLQLLLENRVDEALKLTDKVL